MNKLLKLIYVNFLGLFDVNKIKIARKEGVKSNLENRSIITFIAFLLGGYLLYYVLSKVKVNDAFDYLNIGFILSTLICFVINISLIEPIVFKNNDNDILFSYPISKNQIVFSKLFSVYLKNILFVVLIMFTTFMSFLKVGKVTETLVILYIVCSLFIPFVPIIIVTFLTYINDFLKVKMSKKWFIIVKGLVFLVFLVLVVLLMRRTNIVDLSDGINILNTINPFGYIFIKILCKESILFFLLYIILNVLFISLYNSVMSNNILKICSMLQGINKNQHFILKKNRNLGKTWGFIRKEFLNLFSNRIYLLNTFGFNVVVLVFIIAGVNIIDVTKFKEIENFSSYFNNFVPALLGAFNTLNVMTISSMSLEKDNLQILRTMPIKMSQILLPKWLISFLLSSLFIIIEIILVAIKFSIKGSSLAVLIVLPLVILMFMSLTGLVLDYTFISKKENSDSVIVKQRILVFIPTIISLFIGLFPILINISSKKYYFSGAYALLLVVLMFMEIIYLVIYRKKLLDNLFS